MITYYIGTYISGEGYPRHQVVGPYSKITSEERLSEKKVIESYKLKNKVKSDSWSYPIVLGAFNDRTNRISQVSDYITKDTLKSIINESNSKGKTLTDFINYNKSD